MILATTGVFTASAASDPVIINFSGGVPVEPAPGIKLLSAKVANPQPKEDASGRKAVSLSAPDQKVLFEGGWDSTQPQTVIAVVKLDFEPALDAAPETSTMVFDASDSDFRNLFRIAWRGADLRLATGPVFLGNEKNGLTVSFAGEELGDLKGRWVVIAFSVAKDGQAVGFFGPVAEDHPRLEAAEVVGAGNISTGKGKKFALGGTVFENPKVENRMSIGEVAIVPRALSPGELLGAYETIRAGRSLTAGLGTPNDARAQSLLAARAVKDVDPSQKEKIETSKMVLEFEGGWLTRWENKETGEKIDFGKGDVQRAGDDRQYAPGPWWVDWKLPGNLGATGTQWKLNLTKTDDTAVQLTQSVDRANDLLVHGVQWGLRVPLDQVKLLHIPKGMPPSRLVGAHTLNLPLVPSLGLDGRLGLDAGNWGLRFYVLEGKTGGLLIYMEDPELQHYGTLEFKQGDNNLLISNRSIEPPPWKSSFTGARWVIRQYSGGVNVAAQYYQDYLVKAYKLTKVADRPTAWATKLGYDFVGAPWGEPQPYPGQKRPFFNYTDAWQRSIEVNTQWLENVSKVLKPESVLFYTSGWKLIPNIDKGIPDAGIDPFFAYMCPRARKMGFHVMLHFNGINLTTDTVTYARFWENEAKVRGDNEMRGPIRNLYSGKVMGKKEGGPPGGWSQKMGWNPASGEFTMNPADEQWRYILVSQIVSAVKATGADALHIDVPVLIPDMNCVNYGMNSMEGWRAFGQLLRSELDENGLQHVAIATEVTPCEALLPYVDFAQAARSKSLAGMVDAVMTGKYTLSETTMITTQSGKDKDEVIREREKLAKAKPVFDGEKARRTFEGMEELSVPSINNMVVGPYVQAYPHLGSITPVTGGKRGNADDELKAQIVESLHMWASVQHDTPPNGSAYGWAMFMDVPPFDKLDVIDVYRKQTLTNPTASIRKNGKIFSKFDYGKFALARFWGDMTPQILFPKEWQAGDIGRFQLKDGRQLRVYRADPQTLRWQFVGGDVLTELDLFTGWKNDAVLMKGYEPTWLKNQIDDFQPPAANTNASR